MDPKRCHCESANRPHMWPEISGQVPPISTRDFAGIGAEVGRCGVNPLHVLRQFLQPGRLRRCTFTASNELEPVLSTTTARATAVPAQPQSPFAALALDCAAQPEDLSTESGRDAGFAEWIAAEAAAYNAIHGLHQSTCGGRLRASASDIEEIDRLRRVADERFALVRSAPDTRSVESAKAPERQSHRPRGHRPMADSRRIAFAGTPSPGVMAQVTEAEAR